MKVHFTPERQAQLPKVAAQEGVDAEKLVRDVALPVVEDDDRLRADVLKGLVQSDRGEFVESHEMKLRIEKLLNR